jgi:protein-tyrosine phosphatase
MFVGRFSAETCGPWSDFAVISLGEPDAAEGAPKIQDGWRDVLRLSFHDITPDTLDVEGAYTLMSDADAQAIVAFVKKVAPEVEGIIVHCRAGISRSAAVAKWICSEYQIPFNRHYDRYNDYVYRLMVLAAAGSSDSEASEAYLAELRKAVNRE